MFVSGTISMRLLVVSALLLSAAAAVAAPSFDAPRLSSVIKTLSSDAFEGRGPATRGEDKTVAFITEQMQAIGLEPGGDLKDGKRGWTQAVPLLRASISGTPSLTIAQGGTTMPLTQGEQISVRAALNGAKLVDIKSAPMVFIGYGVSAPERKWDDYKGVDLKGKVAVVFVNDPDFETGAGDFGGKAMTYYGRWTYKYEEAARRGAAGLLIIHETAPAAYGWATVKNSNTNTMFDIVRKDAAKAHVPMEAWIQRDLAVQLFKGAGLDFDAQKALAQTRSFKPVPLKATFTANYAVDSQVITSRNVVGKISGKGHPDEFVIHSAHWDHLGVGQPDARGDKIYNGAIDNATGVAALLELARAYKSDPQPDRSVVFLAVTAEEKGLLGSEYYASNPLYPVGKTVGVINTDSLGVSGPARNFSISGSARLGLLDDLIRIAKTRDRTFTPDPRPEAGGFFRSDHFPFAKKGVPAISFGSGNDLVDGGIERGRKIGQDYVRDRYHQPADEWSADWNLSGMTADLSMLYELGSSLANSREWPEWSADSEFRAARDKTAAMRR